jgi:hypothetical protein
VTRRASHAAGKRCSCRRTCGPFRMHISNKHGNKIQQQASTRYVLMIDKTDASKQPNRAFPALTKSAREGQSHNFDCPRAGPALVRRCSQPAGVWVWGTTGPRAGDHGGTGAGRRGGPTRRRAAAVPAAKAAGRAAAKQQLADWSCENTPSTSMCIICKLLATTATAHGSKPRARVCP